LYEDINKEDYVMTKVLLKELSEDWSYGIWAYIEHVFKNKIEWALMCIFKTPSLWRKKNWFGVWSSRSASSRWNLEEIIGLKLVSILCSWMCEDMLKERPSHSGVWGRNLHNFTKQAWSRKVFHREGNKTVIM
jgi:hypothetical protein